MNNIQCEIIDYFKKQNDNLILTFIENFFPFNLSLLLNEENNEYKKELEEKYEIEIMISKDSFSSNSYKKTLIIKKLNKKTNGYCFLSLNIISNENGILDIEYDGFNYIRKNSVYETMESSLTKESIHIMFRELNQNISVILSRNQSKKNFFYNQNKKNQEFNNFVNLFKIFDGISKELKNDIIKFVLFDIKPLYTKEEKDSLRLLYDVDIEETLVKNKYTHIMRKEM